MSEKFEYKYEAPSVEERKEIENIRGQYLPKDKTMSKLERLRYLDQKVKTFPYILSLSLGVIGLLLFGVCMCFFLEWFKYWYIGIPFGILGTIMIIVAYPAYLKSLAKMKARYGEEIIALSNELLNEK